MMCGFDDFDTQINVEEFEEAMEGFEEWFEELAIVDMLVNDDQWEDFI